MIHISDDSVKPHTVQAIALGFIICSQVLEFFGCDCRLTSLDDKKHGRNSLHNIGHAWDIGIKDFPSVINPKDVVIELKKRLGRHYDVVLESDHIHVEYQPR